MRHAVAVAVLRALRRVLPVLVPAVALVVVACSVPTATPVPFANSTPASGASSPIAGEGDTLPTGTPTPLPSLQGGTGRLSSPTQTPVAALAPVTALLDIPGVVEKARPAVVSIVAEVVQRDLFGRRFRDSQSGSGVIFDPKGLVLTNNHVVEGSVTVTVTLDDGRQFEGEVLGADGLTDLAVLRIQGDRFPFAALADPAGVRVGDPVIAIGNALALPGGPTVTFGVISALDRSFQVTADVQLHSLIQTDAPINPGNSGGPLLNLQGQVVGINTAVARSDPLGREIEGMGFAVGMDTVGPVAAALVKDGRVQWAWLGVALEELDPQMAAEVGVPLREGVLVAGVVRDGPASQGGVRRGDVIVSIGGREVSTRRELVRLLRFEHGVAEKVDLEVFRDERLMTLEVTLGERPGQ